MKMLKRYESWLLYISIVCVIIFRVNVERTSYCTPDSFYYLEVSNNIISGLGPVGPKVFDFNEKERRLIPLYNETLFGKPEQYPKEFFAVWPLGYPTAIVITSLVTGLKPIWASKVLNLVLLAIDFYLFFLVFGGANSLAIYYFCSFSMLEICSHTWSENLFLPFFLLFIYSLKLVSGSDAFNTKIMLLMAFSLIGMCLTRYASIIYYFFCVLIMIGFVSKNKFKVAKTVFGGLFLGAIVVGMYLFNNYLQTGYFTGMPRLETQEFTLVQLMGKLAIGLFNSLHIIKEFRFDGRAEMIVYSMFSLMQVSVMLYVGLQMRNMIGYFKSDALFKYLIFSGLVYLCFLIYITFTSTVDPFDYRTLMPFSFPVAIALFYSVESGMVIGGRHRAIIVIKAFFVFSLLMNLPKRFIWGLIF